MIAPKSTLSISLFFRINNLRHEIWYTFHWFFPPNWWREIETEGETILTENIDISDESHHIKMYKFMTPWRMEWQNITNEPVLLWYRALDVISTKFIATIYVFRNDFVGKLLHFFLKTIRFVFLGTLAKEDRDTIYTMPIMSHKQTKSKLHKMNNSFDQIRTKGTHQTCKFKWFGAGFCLSPFARAVWALLYFESTVNAWRLFASASLVYSVVSALHFCQMMVFY